MACDKQTPAGSVHEHGAHAAQQTPAPAHARPTGSAAPFSETLTLLESMAVERTETPVL